MANSDDIARKLGNSRAEPAATSGDRFEYEKFLTEIKGMLVGDQYEYAEDTLRGIMATVERTQMVTPNQRHAIENIQEHPGRGVRDDRRGPPRSQMRRRREDE